jgi:hypothetical protein
MRMHMRGLLGDVCCMQRRLTRLPSAPSLSTGAASSAASPFHLPCIGFLPCPSLCASARAARPAFDRSIRGASLA